MAGRAALQKVITHYFLFHEWSPFILSILFLSYFTKLGLVKSIKKHQLLVILVVNYSPQHIAEGNFNFYHLKNGSSGGKLKQNLNFIGMELSYSLPTLK